MRASWSRDGCSRISFGSCRTTQVTLAYDEGEGVLVVTSGSHASRLNVYSAEDFPRLPPIDGALQTIDAGALLATIEKVGRAASRDESRPVLTGVLVRFEGEKLVMAATDSYRLAVKETTLASPGPDLDAIIPARALQELTRLAVGCRRRRARRPREPRHLLGRRRLADEPAHRRPVPELQAAAPGNVRGRDRDRPRGAARGRPAGRSHGPAQRAAATALRGGRAHRLGTDAGRRRGHRVAADRLRGRGARDRLQPRFPPGRTRGRVCRDGSAQAHQSPATRPHRGSGRELLVPDHADPPRFGPDRSRGHAPRLPLVRRARARAVSWSRAPARPERRGEDESARGPPRRHPRLLAACTPRRTDDPLRLHGRESRAGGLARRGSVRDGRGSREP